MTRTAVFWLFMLTECSGVARSDDWPLKLTLTLQLAPCQHVREREPSVPSTLHLNNMNG